MIDLSQIPDRLGYYYAGFVDGEGSFNISFRRRRDYKMPWKVSLCLNVSQKDQIILEEFQSIIQCGSIRYKGDGVWMFETNNLDSIRHNVIPFFERFPFRSGKKTRDFDIFRRMAGLMYDGAHLHREGIVQLLELRRNMNDGGKRKYSEDQILAII